MNCVDISGRVRKNIDKLYRYFEFEIPYYEDSKHSPTLIVMKYWTNMPDSRLMTIEENSRVLIHGHLDNHETFGTILIVETIETMHQ